MKKLKRKMIVWLTQTKVYKWALKNVIPYIRFTTYYPSFSGDQYVDLITKVLPGDIILCRDDKKLTTMAIGGELTHAGIVLSVMGGEIKTADMTHENYRKAHLFDMCKESDRVVIVRCMDWDPDYRSKVIEKARSFADCEYDYQFTLCVKALYCSELIYESDFEKRLQLNLEDLAGIGREYISPTGLYRAKNVDIIYDSNTRN